MFIVGKKLHTVAERAIRKYTLKNQLFSFDEIKYRGEMHIITDKNIVAELHKFSAQRIGTEQFHTSIKTCLYDVSMHTAIVIIEMPVTIWHTKITRSKIRKV